MVDNFLEHPEGTDAFGLPPFRGDHQQVERERNAERVRLLINLYGQERYLLETGFVLVHEDDYGRLYRDDGDREEPTTMLKVLNSTPEPDGTFKDYFLRVPPTMKTAREAVAWTFGYRKAEDFSPSRET